MPDYIIKSDAKQTSTLGKVRILVEQVVGSPSQAQISQAVADYIDSHPGALSPLSQATKSALLDIAAHVAYIDANGQSRYDALDAALNAKALLSITAVYTQSGTVYDTDSLDSLKSDLVVTAYYDDGTSADVTSASVLSGTLAVGTSTVTVTYQEKTASFTVTVTGTILFEVLNRAVDKQNLCVDTGVYLLAEDIDFTILMDVTQTNAIPSGSANRLLWCSNASTSWKGIFWGAPNSNGNYGVQWFSGNTQTGFNRTSTNIRCRLAYRHVAGSDKATISYKLNDNAVVSATQTSAYKMVDDVTLKVGGPSATDPSSNWVGTINRCTIHNISLSDDAVAEFFE